ncbi:hypothetical protein Tco_1081482 [Tanacetum coccineum]|uniref:Uncharacterized protein n=1 Tax=Tanacetum coccineum TaxID=301880 RepID=A0ABQ5HZC1_9ASTR
MNCRVDRSDLDAAVTLRRYGLDPLLPTLGHHSMSGIRGDILDVTTPLVGGCTTPPFDRYTVDETDHERYRSGSDPGQGRLRRRLAYGSYEVIPYDNHWNIIERSERGTSLFKLQSDRLYDIFLRLVIYAMLDEEDMRKMGGLPPHSLLPMP